MMYIIYAAIIVGLAVVGYMMHETLGVSEMVGGAIGGAVGLGGVLIYHTYSGQGPKMAYSY